MLMRTAAARASSMTSSPTSARASATSASRSPEWRAAIADAIATPQRWAGERLEGWRTACRFSLMSLAASGRPLRSVSTALTSGDHQRGFALLPIAGAELVGLQRVEDAHHLVHVPADGEVVHGGPADHVLGIDDEGRAQGHAVLLVEDAQLRGQLALGVGQHGKGQALQVGMVLAPGQVDEVGVRARSQNLGVAVREVLLALAELRDLGGADEREVHGPVEDHPPLAGMALLGDDLELLALVEAGHRLQLVVGKVVANGQHLVRLL